MEKEQSNQKRDIVIIDIEGEVTDDLITKSYILASSLIDIIHDKVLPYYNLLDRQPYDIGRDFRSYVITLNKDSKVVEVFKTELEKHRDSLIGKAPKNTNEYLLTHTINGEYWYYNLLYKVIEFIYSNIDLVSVDARKDVNTLIINALIALPKYNHLLPTFDTTTNSPGDVIGTILLNQPDFWIMDIVDIFKDDHNDKYVNFGKALYYLDNDILYLIFSYLLVRKVNIDDNVVIQTTSGYNEILDINTAFLSLNSNADVEKTKCLINSIFRVLDNSNKFAIITFTPVLYETRFYIPKSVKEKYNSSQLDSITNQVKEFVHKL